LNEDIYSTLFVSLIRYQFVEQLEKNADDANDATTHNPDGETKSGFERAEDERSRTPEDQRLVQEIEMQNLVD
jgi:hypothetical protein